MEITIDVSKHKQSLCNRIIHGAELEKYIIANFSTNRVKQAKLYNETVKRALNYLIGIESKKDPIQLFELVSEQDFNTRFMELIDWLEYQANKIATPFYTEVYVSKMIDTELTLKLEFTIVTGEEI